MTLGSLTVASVALEGGPNYGKVRLKVLTRCGQPNHCGPQGVRALSSGVGGSWNAGMVRRFTPGANDFRVLSPTRVPG